MAALSITPDQLTCAGSYISRNWSDYGYYVEKIESPTSRVSVFHVCASDGGRFAVLADRWGNCRHLDTHGYASADAAPLAEAVAAMHRDAVTA